MGSLQRDDAVAQTGDACVAVAHGAGIPAEFALKEVPAIGLLPSDPLKALEGRFAGRPESKCAGPHRVAGLIGWPNRDRIVGQTAESKCTSLCRGEEPGSVVGSEG